MHNQYLEYTPLSIWERWSGSQAGRNMAQFHQLSHRADAYEITKLLLLLST